MKQNYISPSMDVLIISGEDILTESLLVNEAGDGVGIDCSNWLSN